MFLTSAVRHQESSTVYTAIGICHTGLLTVCYRDQDGTCSVPLQNKFEKLVHLVGFSYKSILQCTVL